MALPITQLGSGNPTGPLDTAAILALAVAGLVPEELLKQLVANR